MQTKPSLQVNSSFTQGVLTKVALAVTLATSSQLQAATININAGCTVSNAILSANSDTAVGGCASGSGADTIVLPSASFTFTAPYPGANPLGDTALPVISSEVTLQGENSVLLRSSAVGTPDFRLLAVSQNGSLTISDVGVMNGQSTAGAGVACSQGTLTLLDSRLLNNSSSQQGGGIDALNCTLTINSTSRLSGNESVYGGAIHALNSQLTLLDSRLSDNDASRGGAIALNNSDLQMSNMQMSYNEGSVIGGALYLQQSSSAAIVDSEFVGNETGQTGGAIALVESNVSINGGSLSGNSADNGGAIALQNNSELNLANSQLTQNSVGSFGNGGAIYSSMSSATVTSSSITENQASFGGGLRVRDSSLTATNTYFGNNAADRGGALSVDDSTLTLRSNQISGNSGVLAAGGLLVNNGSVETRLSNNTFTANSSGGYGGGVVVIGSTNVVISQNQFLKNTANRSAGINVSGFSIVTLRESTVRDNSAVTTAGGILIENSELTVQRSTISANAANAGAGILADSSELYLQNSTVSLNTAGFAVAGIQLTNAALRLNHATVFQNSGGAYASGIYRGGPSSSVFLVNSIVASNENSDCNVLADTVFAGNWFGDASCSGTANGDPQLAPLADNGGPTETHALLAGSGAIDGATAGFCENPIGGVDQRGFARLGACDTGAYEFGASDTSFFVIPLPNGGAVIVPM